MRQGETDMFSKSMKTLAALSTSFLALTGFASAQWGMPDFTTMDISGIYNTWAAGQNAQMDYQTQHLISQVYQDPRFQAMYQQYLASGGTASAEQYAYSYAATGGFTPQGMQNYQNSEAMSAAKIQGAWQDYQTSVQGYRDAYGNYTGGFASNMNEAGNSLGGNATYYDAQGSEVLPYGWQPDSYNSYNNQNYYVDYSGQYYWIDPSNGWRYPINQGQ
jgi:hypothetical protein